MSALPRPQDYAANYVTIATRVAAKLLAQVDTPPVTLVAVVGGEWHLIRCDAVLGEGTDQELSDAGKRLTRAVVSELGVEDRSRLLARMDSRDELPGVESAHFKIALSLAGASWGLAHERMRERCDRSRE